MALKNNQQLVELGPEEAAVLLTNAFRKAGASSQATISRTWHNHDGLFRKVWNDVSDPTTQCHARESYIAVREAFLQMGNIYLKSRKGTINKLRAFSADTALRFGELIERTPEVRGSGLTEQRYVEAKTAEELTVRMASREESWFSIGVMVSGCWFAAQTEAKLRSLGKSAGFSLVGHTSGTKRNHDYFGFRDGSNAFGKVLCPPYDSELLEMSKKLPALLLDNGIGSGKTLFILEKELKAMGFSQVYKIDQCSPKRLYLPSARA